MSDKVPLVDLGLDPAAAPAAVAETHISVVVFAGSRAYKVCKAVDLGFLDYSTREQRRAALERELVLNRRFAPDLYREVVALVPRGPGGLAVAAQDDQGAVEYAVVMERYDESRTLRTARATATPEVFIHDRYDRVHRTTS